jgi:hypothetical protein
VQSLVAFTSGGIDPVHFTVTVWPLLDGTVMVLVGGVDAQLNIARVIPMEHKTKAKDARRFIRPDSEVQFFCMIRLGKVGHRAVSLLFERPVAAGRI